MRVVLGMAATGRRNQPVGAKVEGEGIEASFRAMGPDAAAGPNTRGPYTNASACGRGDNANI